MNSARPMMDVAEADAVALKRVLAVQPVWDGIAQASEVIDFDGRMLLHAGPPIHDPKAMAMPVKHSAIMAILYEGWADSCEAAMHLLESGRVTLRPAQDHDAAIPLADVLSESMPVIVASDAHNPGVHAYSTVNGGNGPVMRVGLCNDAVLERLHWVGQVLAPQLQNVLAGSQVELLDVADRALCHGDDCHGRTGFGSQLLLEQLFQMGGRDIFSADVLDFLVGAPAFFLNPWMASVKMMLRAAEGVTASGLVTAIGGNGREFGIQFASEPGRWFTTGSAAPLIPGRADLHAASAGAVGDSAIVDAFGCGAMVAAAHAPETWARIEQVCLEHRLSFPHDLLAVAHPAFVHAAAFRTGLTLQRVHDSSQTPVVSLGVLDRAGALGRFDGGFYFSPAAVFEQAWAALGVQNATA